METTNETVNYYSSKIALVVSTIAIWELLKYGKKQLFKKSKSTKIDKKVKFKKPHDV